MIAFNISIASIEEMGRVEYDKIYYSLTKCRQNKIDKMRFEKDKKLALLAGQLLKLEIEKKGLCYEKLEFAENEYGKPYIVGNDNLFFNLSHSKEMAMCVMSGREIGCDIEYIDCTDMDMKKNMARLFMSENEYSGLIKLQDEDFFDYFYRCWTLKESYVKAVGKGFSIPFSEIDIRIISEDELIAGEQLFSYREWKFDNRYQCAVCVKN